MLKKSFTLQMNSITVSVDKKLENKNSRVVYIFVDFSCKQNVLSCSCKLPLITTTPTLV